MVAIWPFKRPNHSNWVFLKWFAIGPFLGLFLKIKEKGIFKACFGDF